MTTTQGTTLLVPFLLLPILLNGVDAGGTETTCKATTSLISSSVTCHFHKDVSKHKENFIVQFYYPSITSNPDNILYCYWTDTLHCDKSFGVSLNEDVTDQVTVTSTSKADRQSGLYRCQLVPSNRVPSHVCNVTFVETRETTPGDVDKHDQTRETTPGDVDKHDPLAVVSFVGFLLISITILILICLLYKYRHRVYKYIRRWEATNQGSEELGEWGSPLIFQHPSMGRSAGSQAGTDLRLLIIGPQGHGKSSLANTITGGASFPVGHSTAGMRTTREPAQAVVTICGKMIKVVDTPYICDPNSYTEEEQRQQISQWKKMTSPCPSAILLALSGQRMLTTEHFDDCQKLKTLWGDEDFCRRLIVIFTFADKRCTLYPGISLEKQLEKAVPRLKRILCDAGNCYIEVNNTASQEENDAVVKEILDDVERKATKNIPPYGSQAATSPDPQTDVSQVAADTSYVNKSMVSGSEQHRGGTDGAKTATAVSIFAGPQHQGPELKEPLLNKPDIPDTSVHLHPPAPQKVVATTPFTIAQSSSQPQSQRGDPGTTLTAASQSGQNTDTDQPAQQHSQEAGAAGALTASSGSPEQTPLVPVSEDGSEHKDEKEDKSKKKAK